MSLELKYKMTKLPDCRDHGKECREVEVGLGRYGLKVR